MQYVNSRTMGRCVRRRAHLTTTLACAAALSLGLFACAEDDTAITDDGRSSSALHVAPILVPGNPTCADLAPEGVVWQEVRVDPAANGTFTDGVVTVEVSGLPGPMTWSSDLGLDAVFVKGGPNGNLYLYNPESTGDSGLTPPINPSNGSPYGFSHLSFCYDYEDARISIEPDAVNEVGDPHTFTVLVEQQTELGGPWSPVAAGTQVLVELDETFGADAVLDAANTTCDVDLDADGSVDFDGAGTDASGECTVTFTSNSAGTITAHAESTPVVSGSGVFVETGTVDSYDEDGIKRFVDAAIDIGEDAINGIGELHTFTVAVTIDEGQGAGMVAPPVGSTVLVELTSAGGAMAVLDSATCDVSVDSAMVVVGTGTDANGECTVTFYSDTPGSVTGHAEFSYDFDNFGMLPDVTVFRETGVMGNPDAVKLYVDGSLSWDKIDDGAPGLLLGGAEFEVCRTHDWNSDTSTMVMLLVPVCATVEDCTSAPCDESDTYNDVDPDAGEFLLEGLVLGRYTLQETLAPPGYQLDGGLLGPFDVITDVVVDAGPVINIPIPPPPTGEGCTPGFWRQPHHYDSWVGYLPGDLFRTVFGLTALQLTSVGISGNTTLGQAVGDSGGPVKQLMFHAVAALLNSTSPDVDYFYSTAEVIALVQEAFAAGNFNEIKSLLAAQNEAGCPLD